MYRRVIVLRDRGHISSRLKTLRVRAVKVRRERCVAATRNDGISPDREFQFPIPLPAFRPIPDYSHGLKSRVLL